MTEPRFQQKILKEFKPVSYDVSPHIKVIDAFESKAVSVLLGVLHLDSVMGRTRAWSRSSEVECLVWLKVGLSVVSAAGKALVGLFDTPTLVNFIVLNLQVEAKATEAKIESVLKDL
ncbi:hypothetical protein A4X13_0g9273 [Tilletia indica]|uniref:Uncharacterized protein n=1 Tax=Tilletia indica TaxID=43049 RepID=A0A177SXX0_9BASI|nr:hypothetical protein A4X13_0g9273 [Tilletia indica]